MMAPSVAPLGMQLPFMRPTRRTTHAPKPTLDAPGGGGSRRPIVSGSATSLSGRSLAARGRPSTRKISKRDGGVVTHALLDPWGVSQEGWESIESNLFAASLFPYLGFLWLLDRPETKCPPRVSFAFKFLLVFVFATIPAGIYAKMHYGQILANVDWLHGTAESMLTVTNLLLVLALRDANGKGGNGELSTVESALLSTVIGLTLISGAAAPEAADATGLIGGSVGPFGLHAEPWNALSIPTWTVHTSCVIEYLVAMGLVWNYAEVSGNPRWKGLTWGMLPSHSSGICACVYHLFYNAPTLNSLVALQAFLTVVGNTTCGIAAFRIWRYGVDNKDSIAGDAELELEAIQEAESQEEYVIVANAPLNGWEDLGETYKNDSDSTFLLKIAGWSVLGSLVIKYGELGLNAPFAESPLLAALACILVPSLLNVSKWATLSARGK